MCIKEIEQMKRKEEERLLVEEGGEEQRSIIIHGEKTRRVRPYAISNVNCMRYYDLRAPRR